MIEHIVLFNYKGQDILIKEINDHYVVGICGETGRYIWFEHLKYDSFRVARTSGRDYARIIIDKMLMSRK